MTVVLRGGGKHTTFLVNEVGSSQLTEACRIHSPLEPA